MRRRRQLDDVEDRRQTARAWCCVVATLNVVVITAYHFDLADHGMRFYRTHVSGGSPSGSDVMRGPNDARPKTVDDAHRDAMGAAHHTAFDDQHAGLVGGADDGPPSPGESGGGGVFRRPLSERAGPDARLRRLAFHPDGSGVAFHSEPWAALQFYANFTQMRHDDAPCPRDGLAAWLSLCRPLGDSSAAGHPTAHPACGAGWTAGAPRATVPPEYLVGFTLNGTTPLQYRFAGREARRTKATAAPQRAAAGGPAEDFSFSGPPPTAPPPRPSEAASPSSGSTSAIQCAEGAPKVSRDRLQRIYEEVRKVESGYRGAFIGAIRQFAPFFKGKRALVYGSLANPVSEVAVLALGGATHVASVEHRPVCILDPRISSVATEEFWSASAAKKSTKRFDAAVSFSILQHDGLGRYGDVVNPDGDLDAMNELWSLLVPGGLLILGLPVGNDCTVFNTHRVYGRRRLPLLLRGWTVVEARGLPEKAADAAKVFRAHDCPSDRIVTFVLRRTVPAAGSEEEWKRVSGLQGAFPVHEHA